MSGINFSNAEFIRSAASPSQFIMSSMHSVVFAGKSNVGKSSVINCILNRKNFAKVGNTPGKTVHVNYFLIDKKLYLVDLPGYGFASVSRSEKERWAELMEQYFATAPFDFGVMIVDARHKPTADDIGMAEWFKNSECPYVILANKIDKVKKSEVEANLALITETLKPDKNTPVIPFSAQNGQGKENFMNVLSKYI